MTPRRLEAKNDPGAGMQIFADIPGMNFVEFETRSGMHRIANDQWVQFAPKAWSEMVETVFHQMVDAWNEKYGQAN